MNDTIKNWAIDDRPRERMMAHGADALSKAELLAILIGSGVPGVSAVDLMREVLNDYGDSISLLSRASIQDLTKYKGMGPAKAVTVLAACQLANRRLQEDCNPRALIRCSSDIYKQLRPRMIDLNVEECHLLMLNQAHHVMGTKLISRGGLTGTTVDVREVLRYALINRSPVIALAHNHPSGSLSPSSQDDDLTRRLSTACQQVGVRLLDHLIITDTDYYSYAENNKI